MDNKQEQDSYGSPDAESWTTASPDIPLLSRDADPWDDASAVSSPTLLPRWASTPSSNSSSKASRSRTQTLLARTRIPLLVAAALTIGALLVFVIDESVHSAVSSQLKDWADELSAVGGGAPGPDSPLPLAEAANSSHQEPTPAPPAPDSPTQLWLLNQTTNEGVVPFSPLDYAARVPDAGAVPGTASVLGPSGCGAQWLAEGTLCPQLEAAWAEDERKPKLDLVWTWVNGSQAEQLTGWRNQVSDEFGSQRRLARRLGPARRSFGGDVARHFRDHDELRFSIRSAAAAFPPSAIKTLHLLVGDAPAGVVRPSGKVAPSELRLAQVPHWLKLPKIRFSRPTQDIGTWPTLPWSNSPRLQVVPHSSIFKTAAGSEDEALDWRTGQVPSFNSLAIESQTAHIPELGEAFVGLNDDFFILGNMTASDFYNPLSGVVLRFQRDLQVNALNLNMMPDGDSEWRGLGWANSLLNDRFGARSRPYLVHQAKSGSGPLFRELHQLFAGEMTKTAQARFRGKGALEEQTWFLFTHFVIERHREALLWSFFVARSDADYDGAYSSTERTQLLAEIGFDADAEDAPSRVPVAAPVRDSLSDLGANLRKAGLDLPRSTEMVFTSADGFAHFRTQTQMRMNEWRPWPSFEDGSAEHALDLPVCEIDIPDCFGEEFTEESFFSEGGWPSVQETFKRVAFEKPQCGDCILVALLGKSGKKGFSAFLPPAAAASEVPAAVAVGLGPTWKEANFNLKLTPATARETAVNIISRYAYTVGETASTFLSNHGAKHALAPMLERVEADRPAFVAINDDISSYINEVNVKQTDEYLKEWFERQWPRKTRWEQ